MTLQGLTFFPVVLLTLVAFPASISAVPPGAHIDLNEIRPELANQQFEH